MIIAAALVEFGEHGYAGGSVSRIAAAASMSSAGLMHHFPSKKMLFRAGLDDAAHHLPQSLETGLGLRSALREFAGRALGGRIS